MKKIINYKGKKIEINMDTYIKYREIGKELDELESILWYNSLFLLIRSQLIIFSISY